MDFTPLHQTLGRPPGPMTDDMLDTLVEGSVTESAGIDFKRAAYPERGLTQSEFPKDVAAMANSGGGVIVVGIDEKDKVAIGRVDVGALNQEMYERALRNAAVAGITPPVFGLGVTFVGDTTRAVVVAVPASIDGPHLVWRGEYFGAPIRNDADTVWMRERQIETMYRARFDERRNAREALDALYREASLGRPTSHRAWLIAVGRPRVPVRPASRMERQDARWVFQQAMTLAPGYANAKGIHPIQSIDGANPRPGLRRWVARDMGESESSAWKEAWGAVHFDGSVSLAAAMGGARTRDGHAPGGRMDSARLERGVADMMALLRANAEQASADDYEVRIGIEWEGGEPLVIETVDDFNYPYDGGSIPMAAFTPVDATIRNDVDEAGFLDQIRDLATDVINQGGINLVRTITPTPRV